MNLYPDPPSKLVIEPSGYLEGFIYALISPTWAFVLSAKVILIYYDQFLSLGVVPRIVLFTLLLALYVAPLTFSVRLAYRKNQYSWRNRVVFVCAFLITAFIIVKIGHLTGLDDLALIVGAILAMGVLTAAAFLLVITILRLIRGRPVLDIFLWALTFYLTFVICVMLSPGYWEDFGTRVSLTPQIELPEEPSTTDQTRPVREEIPNTNEAQILFRVENGMVYVKDSEIYFEDRSGETTILERGVDRDSFFHRVTLVAGAQYKRSQFGQYQPYYYYDKNHFYCVGTATGNPKITKMTRPVVTQFIDLPATHDAPDGLSGLRNLAWKNSITGEYRLVYFEEHRTDRWYRAMDCVAVEKPNK